MTEDAPTPVGFAALAGSEALPWIEEPTRPGCWLARWEHQGEWRYCAKEVRACPTGPKGQLMALGNTYWPPTQRMEEHWTRVWAFRAAGVVWSGPFESEGASVAAMPPNNPSSASPELLAGAHGSLLAFVEKWNVEVVKKWKETRDSKGHWIAIHSPQWGHTEDLRRRRETSLEMLRWTVQWFKDRGHEIECQIMSDGESIGICEANETRSARLPDSTDTETYGT